MSIDSQTLINKYITFDKPVPYKDLYIYPIKLCDMYDVDDAIDILQIDKNELGDINFISMSNLRFVLLAINEIEGLGTSFEYLLRKALNISDDYAIQKYISSKEEHLILGKILSISEDEAILQKDTVVKIDAEDFNEIRRIILYQNIVDYTDRYIDPDIKRKTDEYYRLKNKDAKVVPLEHKMLCVQAKTGMTLEAIGELSIRNFYQLFDVIVDEDEYIIGKSAELSGSVKFKTPIEHWAYKEKKDKYAEAFCDADSFISHVQSAN